MKFRIKRIEYMQPIFSSFRILLLLIYWVCPSHRSSCITATTENPFLNRTELHMAVSAGRIVPTFQTLNVIINEEAEASNKVSI